MSLLFIHQQQLNVFSCCIIYLCYNIQIYKVYYGVINWPIWKNKLKLPHKMESFYWDGADENSTASDHVCQNCSYISYVNLEKYTLQEQ